MAIVQDGWRLTVSVQDTSASVSTLTYDLIAADQTEADAAVATIIPVLTAATASTVVGYALAAVFVENAPTLPANAQNAEKASISLFLNGLGNKKGNIKIPAPNNTLFVSTLGPGNNIIAENTVTNDYINLFKLTGGVATISDGEFVRDTAPFAGGRRITRGSQNP